MDTILILKDQNFKDRESEYPYIEIKILGDSIYLNNKVADEEVEIRISRSQFIELYAFVERQLCKQNK